jgi:uncharacterized OsmC-like protein
MVHGAWRKAHGAKRMAQSARRSNQPTHRRPGYILAPPASAMKITLLADDQIRLEPVPGPMTIEAASAETSYSPFHMLASSLATCTFSVIESWASHAKLSLDDLTIDVRWKFGEDPHRVSNLDVSFTWPSLPANRVAAAKRVAELCTVHATLLHAPTITIAPAAQPSPEAQGHHAVVA